MTGMAIERDFRKLALATQAELRRVAVAMVRAGKTRIEAAEANDTATTEIYTLSLHDALGGRRIIRSEEHTSELQSHDNLVCRLLLEKKPAVQQRSAVSIGILTPPAGRGVDREQRGCATPGSRCFFLMIRRPPRPSLFPPNALSR